MVMLGKSLYYGKLSLETAVEREKDVQHIDMHRLLEKLMVTLLVMRVFSNYLGALRGCADFRNPIAVSRISVPGGSLSRPYKFLESCDGS